MHDSHALLSNFKTSDRDPKFTIDKLLSHYLSYNYD